MAYCLLRAGTEVRESLWAAEPLDATAIYTKPVSGIFYRGMPNAAGPIMSSVDTTTPDNLSLANVLGSSKVKFYFVRIEAVTDDTVYGISTSYLGSNKWLMAEPSQIQPLPVTTASSTISMPTLQVDTTSLFPTQQPPNDQKYQFKIYRQADGTVSIRNLEHGWVERDGGVFTYFTCTDQRPDYEGLPAASRFTLDAETLASITDSDDAATPNNSVQKIRTYKFRNGLTGSYVAVGQSSGGLISNLLSSLLNIVFALTPLSANGQAFQFLKPEGVTDDTFVLKLLPSLIIGDVQTLSISADGSVKPKSTTVNNAERFRLVRNDFSVFGEFAIVSASSGRALARSLLGTLTSKPFVEGNSRDFSFQIISQPLIDPSAATSQTPQTAEQPQSATTRVFIPQEVEGDITPTENIQNDECRVNVSTQSTTNPSKNKKEEAITAATSTTTTRGTVVRKALILSPLLLLCFFLFRFVAGGF